MGEFTKGPWRWIGIVDSQLERLVGADDELVMSFGSDESYDQRCGYAPEKPDSDLLASAPDLLEALDLCLAELEAEHIPTDEVATAIVKARAAIARARGEA